MWLYLHLTHIGQLTGPPPTQLIPTPQTFSIYVIMAHMIVSNTLNQYIPSIDVDCHLVGCKSHENITWGPILSCMSAQGLCSLRMISL